MKSTLALLAIVFVLLAILEILNAFYAAFVRGTAEDMSEDDGEISLVRLPFELLRRGVAVLSWVGQMVSLIGHELAHAAMQLVFLGRPRVVLCKNGGYAASTPWIEAPPAQLAHGVGFVAGGGLMSLGPILVMGAIVYGLFAWLTPLDGRSILNGADALAAHLSARGVWHAAVGYVKVLGHTSWWRVLAVVVVMLVLAPCMTPSSLDYYSARYHLPGYAIGVTGAVWAFSQPRAVGTGLIVVCAVVTVASLFALEKFKPVLLVGAAAAACGALLVAQKLRLLGDDPTTAVKRLLAVVALGLVLAAMLYVAFVIYFVLTAVLALRFGALGKMLACVPDELYEVFVSFDTCTDCNIHFRKTCDGCGRTVEEIAQARRREHEEAVTMAPAVMPVVEDEPDFGLS